MTAFYAVLFVLGALLSGPAWMAYALKQEKDRQEWQARKRARDMRR